MKLELDHADLPTIRDLTLLHNYRGVIEALQGRKPFYLKEAPKIQRAAYFLTLGSAHSKIGEYKQADECFDSALSATPKPYKIKLEMIESYIQRGELYKAGKCLVDLSENTSIYQSGYCRRFHLLMGSYFKVTGDYAAAHESYVVANNLDRKTEKTASRDVSLMEEFLESTDLRTYNTMGMLEYANYLRHIDFKENPQTRLSLIFLQNCMPSVKAIDDKLQCLTALSRLSLAFKDLAAAVEYNKQALALDANHAQSLATRIRLMFATGKENEAMDFYQKDLDIIKEDPRATLALAKAMSFAGRHDISLNLATELLSRANLPKETSKSAKALINSIYSIKCGEQPASTAQVYERI